MAQQTINVGTAPNDGTGTPLRTAFQYTNSNFSELYTAVGPSGNNIVCPGSATITGDLTVDTSTLKVDSANNRVGIVNASPSFPLDLTGTGSNTPFRLLSGSGTSIRYDSTRNVGGVNRNWILGCDETAEGSFALLPSTTLGGSTFTNPVYRVTAAGVHTFFDGAGGTYATLNATGLGIGASPTQKLHVKGVVNFEQVSGGTNGWQVYTYTDGTYRMNYNGAGADELIIDTSGNVGIGVTPSAFSGVKALQIGTGALYSVSSGSQAGLLSNAFYDGAWKYISTSFAARYDQPNGSHQWFTAPSGTAGNAISFTQAMTLDASGNLLVGTTTNTDAYRTNIQFSGTSVNGLIVKNLASTGGPVLLYLHDSAQTVNTATVSAEYTDSTTQRWRLYKNGGLANYQANNVNLSDVRTKTDIKPLGSYWNKIKSLEVVTFKYKDQTHSDDNIGLIAQQVESVAPELVDADGFGNTPEDGVPLKTIYTTDLYHAAIKALQEAMTRIEVLESKLA